MTQFNLDDPINPSTKTGSVLASDLSSWRDSLHTCHSGTIRPTWAKAGTTWINTSATPWLVNIYDGTQDVVVGTLNATTHNFIPGSSAAAVFADIKQIATTTSTGVAELATDTEALSGTDSDKIVTSTGLASFKQLASNGWQKLPGGLILQWGSGSVPGESSAYHAFPMVFPTAAYSLTLSSSQGDSGGGTGDYWGYHYLTNAGFNARTKYNGTQSYTFIAIGI